MSIQLQILTDSSRVETVWDIFLSIQLRKYSICEIYRFLNSKFLNILLSMNKGIFGWIEQNELKFLLFTSKNWTNSLEIRSASISTNTSLSVTNFKKI